MKVYQTDKVRNIAMVGHQGSGKTSLTESMIYNTGAINRLGKVADGNTVADYFPEETKRKITVNTSLVACEWKDFKINLLDTPGFSDFLGEVESSLRVADCLAMVVDAVAGVEVSTEVIWDIADSRQLPIISFINKMDRENADFMKAFESLIKLSRHVVVLQLPIGSEANFSGIVDIVANKAYVYDASGKPKEAPIPADMADQVARFREELIEYAAEGDDELTMKYLEGEELTHEEIIHGLHEGVKSAKIVPILCGSAMKNIGIDIFMDFLTDYAPSPLATIDPAAANEPPAALIFKTMADPFVGKLSFFKVYQGTFKAESTYYNPKRELDEKVGAIYTMQGKTQQQLPSVSLGDIGVVAKLGNTYTNETLTTKDCKVQFEGVHFSSPTYTVAIAPKSKGDEDKLGSAITRLLEEDGTLRYDKSVETKQTQLTGMGETHINIVLERLQRKFGVDVEIIPLRIPYREAIKGKASHVEGKHKKQSGGHGQYGHVFIDMEPCPDADFVFEEKIFGGSVPKQYIPAVEKGVKEAMVEGILAGYPVSNIKVTLLDGSYHPVDSSEMAFKIATSIAFKKACEMAKPILLEPIMNVKITVPDQYMGDIMSDMNTRRGRIMGMEKEGKTQIIRAQAPLAEMTRYCIDLKSITQGRGRFKMSFYNYEEVPAAIAEKVVAEAKAAAAKE